MALLSVLKSHGPKCLVEALDDRVKLGYKIKGDEHVLCSSLDPKMSTDIDQSILNELVSSAYLCFLESSGESQEEMMLTHRLALFLNQQGFGESIINRVAQEILASIKE
ncbi:MAG: hypothetical protein P0S95_00135 [Rhabdochlamydiaceae bacterium]|nr:hypothetical protein [Candidatus Amphrikana amoebophyrae]